MSDFYSTLEQLTTARCPTVRPQERAIIFGAGNTGRKLLRVLVKRGCETIAFLDGQPKTDSIDGVPVRTLSDPAVPRDATVIVAVFNREINARFGDIERRLQLAGYTSILSFEQFFLSCPDEFEDSYYWLAKPDYLRDRIDEVKAADALWADTRSRDIYRSQLQYRATGDSRLLPEANAAAQYNPKDVPLLPDPYRFIDIGAYDGDTLEILKAQHVRLESLVAFEPDMRNFQALVKRVSAHGPYAPQTLLLPCGVGRTCGATEFSGEGAESSKAFKDVSGARGNFTKVPIVSLDEMLAGYRPNYIKFDVEGFEEEALCGMRNTVEANRPMLAVSVYHRPEDLFLLPLLLASWNYPADFYLRMHGEHSFDTVLYTIPRR